MTAILRGPLGTLLAVALLTAAALLLYAGQFVETNAYIGIGELPWHRADYWWILTLWLLGVALLLPARPRSPSDIFLCLYLIGCGLWSAGYWPATQLIDVGGAAALGALLLLPALLVRLMASTVMRSRGLGAHRTNDDGRKHLLPVLLTLLALAALLGYRVAGSDAGFSFDEAVTRRLQGRESFTGNAIPGYLLQMSANGLAPFVAFLGMLARSRLAVMSAMAFAVLCFWLLGLKSPVLNVVALAALGWLLRGGRIGHLTLWLLSALGAVLFLALVELFIFDLSLIAEFGVRRVILVNATIQSYFVDALSRTAWFPLLTSGFDLAGHTTPEYYIGATYFGSELTNANTNAFLHELATNGLFGYFAVALAAAAFLAWCDHIWHVDGREDGFAFAAVLGILMIEQAFTTVLVSSGLVVCILLSMLFARRRPSTLPTALGTAS